MLINFGFETERVLRCIDESKENKKVKKIKKTAKLWIDIRWVWCGVCVFMFFTATISTLYNAISQVARQICQCKEM